MNSREKMWAVLVNLGAWEAGTPAYNELPFDQDVWDYIVDEAANIGLNTIVLDIGGGIDFASHPELTLKGAWSRKKLREEISKCKSKNLTIIPKLNFATPHDIWLGEYERMVSTPIYYRVCNDMIKEAYELFDHPEYIHIGMDEEDADHAIQDLVTYRKGELYWHDIRFFIDCVKDTGAKPWMWACPLFDHPEEYKKHIDADEAVISPWYYCGIRKEHWFPIAPDPICAEYYSQPKFADLKLEYVEEDPWYTNVRKVALPLMKEGYQYVPCAAISCRNDYNAMDLLEYFKEGAPDNQILGFMTAAWYNVVPEKKEYYEKSLKLFKEAKEIFYK